MLAEFGFLIKKLVGILIMPLPVSLLLITVGLVLFKKRRYKMARVYTLAGLASIILFSLPITSQFLIKPIEFSHPKLPLEDKKFLKQLDPSYVVVMGCWHSDDEKLPLVAKIHQCSLPRVVQAVQIWHQLPSVKIIFSGYSAKDDAADKQSDPGINAELANALGVPFESILIIEGTKDSEDEIIEQKKILNKDKFIVVSSATHINRLDLLYKSYGLTPIFSPAEYVSGHGDFSWQLFIPSSSALLQSERAIYEILGNIWVSIKYKLL